MPWPCSGRRICALGSFSVLAPIPHELEEVGLNVIEELHRKFGCPVGLSDHSGSVFPGSLHLARGANILEVHLTFHRGMFGPDVPASLTFDELGMLCTMRDALFKMDSQSSGQGWYGRATNEFTRDLRAKSWPLSGPFQQALSSAPKCSS